MKTSFWYAIREMWRRPRQFLSLTAVSAAVMTVLMLMILWMNASWRAEVLPLNQSNTHMYFYNLTEQEKEYIRQQDYVQITYDTYNFEMAENSYSAYLNCFRVRLTWEHNADAPAIAAQLMKKLNLYTREPYVKKYENEYNYLVRFYEGKWGGARELNGKTVEQMATNGAQNETITTLVMNRYYVRQVQNSYWMQPKFFMMLVMFTMFLSAATTVLTLETYRSKFCDFGTLRALGMRRRDIFFVNWITSSLVTLFAIPIAIGAGFGAVQLYKWIVAPFGAASSSAYTIDSFIPWGTLAVLALFMILSALAGTTIVCLLYRTKTTLSLLRREGTFTVPFVSKTSPAFERSEGVGGYNRLYKHRARSMLLRYSLVTAVLLPLPMYYIFTAVLQFFTATSSSDQISLIYTVFQLVGVLITTMCVAIAASRMFAGSRVGEFAVMRALGADHRTIRRVAFSTAAWQAKAMLLFALVLTWLVNGITAPTYIDSTEGAKSVSEILLLLFGYGGSALLFIMPAVYGGLNAVLHRFFRRPIITAIREKE